MSAEPVLSFESFVRDLVRDTLRDTLREDRTARRNAAQEPAADDAYVSVAKAARVADVAPGTIRRWIRTGRLTAKHAGRVLRVSRGELERFMRNEATGPQGREIERKAAQLFSSKKSLRSRSV